MATTNVLSWIFSRTALLVRRRGIVNGVRGDEFAFDEKNAIGLISITSQSTWLFTELSISVLVARSMMPLIFKPVVDIILSRNAKKKNLQCLYLSSTTMVATRLVEKSQSRDIISSS